MGVRILSMGAGVQTAAMAVKWIDGYDHVVFAETGEEKPETYEYIRDYLRPFCGAKWEVVHSRYGEGVAVFDYAIEHRMMPTRMRRWCTREFKIDAIRRFLRERGATRKDPAVMDLGISWDEAHRMNESKHDVLYVKKNYPLIDARMTRQDCLSIIAAHGWPAPVKSGCIGCPFAGKKAAAALAREDPERFGRLLRMEEGAKNFPGRTLFDGTTLRRIREKATGSQQLTMFMEEEPQECETGHCFA